MSVIANPILIASNNAHKLQEFREIFRQFQASNVELVTPRDLGIALDPEETADSYLGNARIKARAFHNLVHGAGVARANDFWVLADDSGLEVDALGGAPGIRSARYHQSAPGHDGSAALLRELADIPEERRTARFHAVIVLVASDGREQSFEGVCEGAIGFEKRGSGGFGFDPVFRLAGDTRHMAELTADEKHRLSHRGRAMQQLIIACTDGKG